MKVLTLSFCVAMSLNGIAQLPLENTSNCDVRVSLYLAKLPDCSIVDTMDFLVTSNGGSQLATPPSGMEFISSMVKFDSCSASSSIRIDPDGCGSCPQNFPSQGTLVVDSTGCGNCEYVNLAWINCDNHYIIDN